MPDIGMFVGARVIDDRGAVGYVNGFTFDGVRRSYIVTNHRRGYVRAWHGHKAETKWLTVVKGAALVVVIEIDDWASPSQDLPFVPYVLSGERPTVLRIPPGCVHGTQSLTEDAIMIFYSSLTVEESQADDYRFCARRWDVWQENER